MRRFVITNLKNKNAAISCWYKQLFSPLYFHRWTICIINMLMASYSQTTMRLEWDFTDSETNSQRRRLSAGDLFSTLFWFCRSQLYFWMRSRCSRQRIGEEKLLVLVAWCSKHWWCQRSYNSDCPHMCNTNDSAISLSYTLCLGIIIIKMLAC